MARILDDNNSRIVPPHTVPTNNLNARIQTEPFTVGASVEELNIFNFGPCSGSTFFLICHCKMYDISSEN